MSGFMMLFGYRIFLLGLAFWVLLLLAALEQGLELEFANGVWVWDSHFVFLFSLLGTLRVT
jgi:hypothetical protein